MAEIRYLIRSSPRPRSHRNCCSSSLRKNLHIDPVGVLDVQARIGVVFRSPIALLQIACRGFLAETGNADREVIHDSGRALMVERNQCPGGAEANNSERLVLADHSEAERFLIEIDRALQ